jgi:ADP-heptose:LPS heptosyltransferase
MNERIKELESQCWEARQYGPPWFNYKKFAELIEKNHNVSDVYLVGKADGRLEAIYECIEYLRNCGAISRVIDLKEHFGVE